MLNPKDCTIELLLQDILPEGGNLKIQRNNNIFLVQSSLCLYRGKGLTIKRALIDFQIRILMNNEITNFGFWVGNIDWTKAIKELKNV